MTEPARNSLKEAVARGIPRRYRSERLFRTSGMLALLIGLAFLAFFFYTLIGNGYTAFWQTRVTLEINLDAAVIDPNATRDPEVIAAANFQGLIRDAPGVRLTRSAQVHGAERQPAVGAIRAARSSAVRTDPDRDDVVSGRAR